MITRMMLLTVLLLTGPLAVSENRLINIEEAAEVMQLEIKMQSSGMGVIYARMCDDCELMRLEIDNSTLIRQGRSVLSLKEAIAYSDRGATVLFDPVTQKVTRVLFWK